MTTQNDILRKGLGFSASTNPSAQRQEERLKGAPFKDTPRRQLSYPFGQKGATRFVGAIAQGTLIAVSTPTAHPARSTALTEETIFYGATVYAEGTAGEVTGVATFDAGFDVSYLAALLGGGEILCLALFHRSIALAEDDQKTLGVFNITNVGGSLITVETTRALPDLLDDYTWAVFTPAPTQLLPFPQASSTTGKTTTYCTILPQGHPAYRKTGRLETTGESYVQDGQPIIDQSTVATGSFVQQADGRILATLSHAGGSAIYAEGDFIFTLNGLVGRTIPSSFVPGAPSTEEIIIEPFWDVNISDLSANLVAFRLLSVQEVLDLGVAALPIGGNIYSKETALASLRVKPLVAPLDGPFALRGQSGAEIYYGAYQRQIGYGVTLYPADALGAADTSKPITNFDTVILDPDVDEPQSITIDYAEGILSLSHPISLTGGDLNPAGFTDGSGAPRIFASFFAYQDVAEGVVRRPVTQNQASTFTWEQNTRISTKGEGGFTYTFPVGASYLAPTPTTATRQTSLTLKPDLNEDTDEGSLAWSWELVPGTTQLTQMGQIIYGRLDKDDPEYQFTFAPDTVALDYNKNRPLASASPPSLEQPFFGIAGGLKTATSFSEFSWGAVSAGVNDQLNFLVNRIRVAHTLPPGVYTAITLAAEIQGAITAAALAQGEATGGISVVATITGEVDISAYGIYFLVGSAHSNLGFPESMGIQGEELDLLFGYNSDTQNRLSYNALSNFLTYDGQDIRVNPNVPQKTRASLVDTALSYDRQYPHYMISGGLVTDAGGGLFNVTGGTCKHAAVAEREGNTVTTFSGSFADLTGQPAAHYVVYYDPAQDDINVIDSLSVGYDPSFNTTVFGVPLAVIDWDGLAATSVKDMRRYAREAQSSSFLTVGFTGLSQLDNADFETLEAALTYITYTNTGVREIRLLTGFVLDNKTHYIPPYVTINGQGNTLVLLNYTTPPFICQNPLNLDISQGVIFKELTLAVAAGFNSTLIPPSLIQDGQGTLILDHVDVTQASGTTSNIEYVWKASDSLYSSMEVLYCNFELQGSSFGLFSEQHKYVVKDCSMVINATKDSQALLRIVQPSTQVILERCDFVVDLALPDSGRCPIVRSASNTAVGVNVVMRQCDVLTARTTVMNLASTAASPSSWLWEGGKLDFDSTQRLITSFGLSTPDSLKIVWQDIKGTISTVGGANHFELGINAQVYFTRCDLERLRYVWDTGGTSGSLSFRDCTLRGQVSGESHEIEVGHDGVQVFFANTFADLKLYNNFAGAALFTPTIKIHAVHSHFEHLNDPIIEITGTNVAPLINLDGCTFQAREGEGGEGALISLNTPGLGFGEMFVQGCTFKHTSGSSYAGEASAIQTVTRFTSFIIANSYFRDFTAAAAAGISCGWTVAGGDINLSVTGCQFYNYPVTVGPPNKSVAIVLFANADIATLTANVAVQALTLAADFTLDGTNIVNNLPRFI